MAREIEHGTRAAFSSVDDSNGFVNRRSPVQSWAPAPSSRRPVPANRKPLPHPSIHGAMLVPLTQGRFALIDERDAEAVARTRWSISGTGRYAVNTATGTVFLHRFIWGLSGGAETPYVDHIDRDELNCTRANLRAATASQNIVNSKVRRDRFTLWILTEEHPDRGEHCAKMGALFARRVAGDEPTTEEWDRAAWDAWAAWAARDARDASISRMADKLIDLIASAPIPTVLA